MAGSLGSSQPSEGSGHAPQRRYDARRPSNVFDSGRPSVPEDIQDGRPSYNLLGGPTDNDERNTSSIAGHGSLERPTFPTRIIKHKDLLTNDHSPANDAPKTDQGSDHEDIDSVLLPSSEDPPPAPWTATAMLRPLIDYHLEQLSDVQLPAHLLLLLGPYIENDIPKALMASIFLTYHSQLVSLSLHTQAARLRKVASSLCPEVAEHGTYGITAGGPWCTNCNKPNKGDIAGFCSRCHEHWADCPICDGQGLMSVSAGAAAGDGTAATDEVDQLRNHTWGWCQGCGHGGHVGCLRMWWDDVQVSEGGCPTLGCLHDCMAGTRRAAILQRKAENKKASTVKGDAWVVGESRAVEKTRGLIGSNDKGNVVVRDRNSTRSPIGSRGPLSMACMGRTGSGGKKVRLLVPQMDSVAGGPDGAKGENRASAPAPSHFSQ
ncbi:MAG: hypothetical protein LQ338_007925 [Usnochroma carphineum]|nr:MAG: hypothetical protein LQ338_007925 [Usnochroma carphineum]